MSLLHDSGNEKPQRGKTMKCNCYRTISKISATDRRLVRRKVPGGKILVKCRICQRSYVVDMG